MRKEFLIDPTIGFCSVSVEYRDTDRRICVGSLTNLFECHWIKGRRIKRYLVLENKPSKESYKLELRDRNRPIWIYTCDFPDGRRLPFYHETEEVLRKLLKKHGTLYVSMEIEE